VVEYGGCEAQAVCCRHLAPRTDSSQACCSPRVGDDGLSSPWVSRNVLWGWGPELGNPPPQGDVEFCTHEPRWNGVVGPFQMLVRRAFPSWHRSILTEITYVTPVLVTEN
jgi:hypothetical protein